MSYNQPPPGGYDGGYAAPQGNNKKAVWSLVLGILGIICCQILAIPALIMGRSAQAEIAAGNGTGAGMAKAGFILGIIGIVFLVVNIILLATGVYNLDFNASTT